MSWSPLSLSLRQFLPGRQQALLQACGHRQAAALGPGQGLNRPNSVGRAMNTNPATRTSKKRMVKQ